MDEKNKVIKKVSICGIFFNLFLMVIKIVIGIFSHSQAMLADGFNSAGDIFASLMSFIGNKLSAKPQDKEHPYGHGKAEYIFSFIISASMIWISLFMLKSSVISMFDGSNIIFSKFLVIVCVITILTKLCLYLYTKQKYQKYDNILLKVNMEDHRNDMFLTLGTLFGIFFSSIGYYFVDGLIGSIISLWIGGIGIQIAKKSYEILMDTDLSENLKQNIIEIVQQTPEVLHVDSIRAKPTGNQYIVILKISMEGNLTLNESHKIAGKIKEKILKELDYICDVIIHINPH